MTKQSKKIRTLGVACALLAALIAVNGCAPIKPDERPATINPDNYWIKPGQTQSVSPAVSLLIYFDYLRNMSSADYLLELERIRDAAATDKSTYRSLQYALALSLPGGDTRKAQQLIENLPHENSPAGTELAALASLAASDLADRRRLELEIKRLESDAKRMDVESKRADAEAKRADAETKRADELQKKVDAVTDIEKKLIDRKKIRTDK